MTQYRLHVTLQSSALIGSGEGFGAIIDSDIVADELGLPYLPSKRIKGCLRDAANQVADMFLGAGVSWLLPSGNPFSRPMVEKNFGQAGQREAAPVCFANLTLADYEANRLWLQYYCEKYQALISPSAITETFTELRQSTALDAGGVAKKHALRTIRVASAGLEFAGEVSVQETDAVPVLALACANLHHLGTKRNRGFGKIACKLYNGQNQEMTGEILQELETVCKG